VFISPSNKPESTLSGSTTEAMINRAKTLGKTHFAIADNGYLISVLKSYMYCKKQDLKLIPGVEIFFKDPNCEFVRNTESERIKYFKLLIHAKDQTAYQALVKLCSNFDERTIEIGENKYPLLNWKDLEFISKFNVTATTTNTSCMVSKHLTVGRADVGLKYYLKLKELFKDDFYLSLLPVVQDTFWNAVVKITYVNGKVIEIPANDRVEIKGKNRTKAVDIVKELKYNKTCNITHIYINKVKYPVQAFFQEIHNAELSNDFQKIGAGDIQLKANKFIYALASRYDDLNKLLINDNSFYALKSDKIVQDMKLGEDYRTNQAQHMQSMEEVLDYFQNTMGINEAMVYKMIENSNSWAEKFNKFQLKYDYRLPDVGLNPEKQFMDIVNQIGRMKWDDPRYVNMFKEEYSLLTKNGVVNLLPYFLPLVDIFDYYDKNGYLTGPARGSAGGFLLSYLMGITHIDPIKYDLSSSRFLTLDRLQQGNLPDIDSDFESREPLVGKNGSSGFLYGKYGNKAAQLSTRTLLRIKSAMLDANRFVNKGTLEEEVQALSKSLPNTPQGVSDKNFIFGYVDPEGNHVDGLLTTNKALQNYTEKRPEEWGIVQRALSLSRQNSRHACAYLIADVPIEDIVPVFEIGGVKRVTQPEHKQCEFAKLIKYDFLVVSAVKDNRVCLEYINKKHGDKCKTGWFKHKGVDTYIWDLPEDPEVYKMLGEGNTESVFQFNTTAVTPFVKRIKPSNIIDLATITSLVRPGPLNFVDETTGRNMVAEYVERRHGNSTTDIPILLELLPETYGVLVYQEQVTKIAQVLGKMNIIDSENVRIAMGKKKVDLLDSLKPEFIKGARLTVGDEVAEKIWQMMAAFAGYGFNKSHAVAYSVISYACAFMKYHYPLEWWASVLGNADNKEINEVFYKYVKDMVLPPDINLSNETISIDYTQNKLRNKLSMINGLGKKAAEKIIDGRPYADISEFVRKKVCGDELTRKLILVGVLDSLFPVGSSLTNKMQTFENELEIVKFNKSKKEKEAKLLAETDEKKKARAEKAFAKFLEAGIPEGEIPPKYFGLGVMKAFQMKKSIFPTINLDLHSLIIKRATNKIPLIKRGNDHYLILAHNEEFRLAEGHDLQELDSLTVPEEVKTVRMAVAGYVVDTETFYYKQKTKKALKILIDCSGYISEKVMWPDRITGELEYPKELKKGCIVYMIVRKSHGYDGVSVEQIIIEQETIDNK
jgi:DNA-directed DNA polymerase III PolC